MAEPWADHGDDGPGCGAIAALFLIAVLVVFLIFILVSLAIHYLPH